MLIIDAHLDLSWNALQCNRDLLSSVHTIRTQENRTQGKGYTQGTVAIPEMRKGRIAICFATLFARSTGQPVPHTDYASPIQSYGVTCGQLAYYRALEQTGHVRIIENRTDLETHITNWETWESRFDVDMDDAPPLGFVVSMEGADSIGKPSQLEEWWQAGLRLLSLAHYGPGRYAGGTGTELGLTELGPHLLTEMENLGMLLDLTHCSDQSFWQALDHYQGKVLASHNNCRKLVPHQRQFSDEQLRAIIQRDGVIGVAFDAWMLQFGFTIVENTNHSVTLATVVDHIDYICQLAGDSRHAAIGTDLDGGYGREQSPSDLDTIADLQKLVVLLADRGYKDNDIAAIMHGNWIHLLRQAWAN